MLTDVFEKEAAVSLMSGVHTMDVIRALFISCTDSEKGFGEKHSPSLSQALGSIPRPRD